MASSETDEKPVREQLKKASIDAPKSTSVTNATTDVHVPEHEEVTSKDNKPDTVQNGSSHPDAEERGRLQRKRSFEDLEAEEIPGKEAPPTGKHGRKRSRDSTVEDKGASIARLSGEYPRPSEETADGESIALNASRKTSNEHSRARNITPENSSDREEPVGGIVSPKTKRSRLEDAGQVERAKLAPRPAPSSQHLPDAPEQHAWESPTSPTASLPDDAENATGTVNAINSTDTDTTAKDSSNTEVMKYIDARRPVILT